MSDVRDFELDDFTEKDEFEYLRRGLGPRSQRNREEKKRRQRQSRGLFLFFPGGLVGVAVVVGLMAGVQKIGNRKSTTTKAPVATQQTWLLIGTLESDTSGAADWMSVMSWDIKKKTGFMLYIPKTMLVEIPGYGGAPETIDKALALGREPLLVSTLANLLGIQLDHELKISDQGVHALFDNLSGVTVELDQRLTKTNKDGKVQVVFSDGKQHLDGKRVSEYMSFVNENGDEISRGARHSTIWRALFDRKASSPTQPTSDSLGKVVANSKDLYSTDAKPEEVVRLFNEFSDAKSGDLTMEILPVKQTGVEAGTQIYAPDAKKIEEMVKTYLSGSRPFGAGRAGRRLEILNGNGSPGIGQDVSDQLIPKGFKVILNQNAKNFDYATTQIVVYSGSKASLAIAQQVKDLLGVGEVVISRQSQSLVDVTIVVGKDYLERKKG